MHPVKANPTTKEERAALKSHILGSYMTLRYGMGVMALLLPLILYIVGKAHGISLQGSMSAYYWAGADGIIAPRTIFVGGLLALGAFFYLYKGFTRAENIALNFAAFFAAMVAFFPMSWNCSSETLSPANISYCPADWNPHGTCAIALFICLAYVSIFRSHDTLFALNNKKQERLFSRIYRITGALMIASPLSATIMRQLFNKLDAYTYFIELSGVVAFALFWILKTIELSKTRFVEKSLESE